MRALWAICLLAPIAVGPRLYAEVRGDTGKRIDALKAKLATALTENKALKKLVAELNEMSEQLDIALAAQKLAVEEIKKSKLKAATEYQARAGKYKWALAENKMLKARIKSLIRSGGSSTSKPAAGVRNRTGVKLIEITLHDKWWEWWTDPLLLTEHIKLRRKLVHLDADHSIDAWLVRCGEFTGTKVDWPMKLVSGRIISKDMVNAIWKEARQDLSDTLTGAVYGKSRPRKTANARIIDRRIGARATSRPATGQRRRDGEAKIPENPGRLTPRYFDVRRRTRNLREEIELYKRASASGGMTTIYAVAGNIAVKMALPGRHFENVSIAARPRVQITGHILTAAPKAGFFAGRKDSMIQFVVIGECKMKNPPAPEPKPE